MNLHLHIEELVLHGFAPGDRARIADALQRGLAQLFTEAGIPPALARGGGVDRMNAGSVPTATAAPPETTGAGIARAVYGALATWGRP
jgi:hypothetical protein